MAGRRSGGGGARIAETIFVGFRSSDCNIIFTLSARGNFYCTYCTKSATKGFLRVKLIISAKGFPTGAH